MNIPKGTLVRVKKSLSGSPEVGKIGRICTETKRNGFIGIEFLEKTYPFHNCDGACRKGYGYFMYADYIEVMRPIMNVWQGDKEIVRKRS